MILTFSQLEQKLRLYNIGSVRKLIYTMQFDPVIREFFNWYRHNNPQNDRPLSAPELFELITIMLKRKKPYPLFESIFASMGIDPEQLVWRNNLSIALIQQLGKDEDNKYFTSICNLLSKHNIEITPEDPVFSVESPFALNIILTRLSILERLNEQTLALILSFKNLMQIVDLFYAEPSIQLGKQWDRIIAHPDAALIIRGMSKLLSLGYKDALIDGNLDTLMKAPALKETVAMLAEDYKTAPKIKKQKRADGRYPHLFVGVDPTKQPQKDKQPLRNELRSNLIPGP